MNKLYDLVILGNGIAGMTASIYAKRAGIDFALIGYDSGIHGQVDNAISIENYMAFPYITGFELGENFQAHIEKYGVSVLEHYISEIKKNENYYTVICEDGELFNAKSVIYALGCTHRKLNANISDDVWLNYCATCDGFLYRDKCVAVVGGGNSAFTEALYLSKICKSVNIVMCDDNITADAIEVDRVKNTNNISITMDFPVEMICKNSDHKLEMYSTGKDEIEVDGIFVAIGLKPQDVILPAELSLSDDSFIIGDESCRTNLDGFFVAGDARTKMLRQCVTASADGANAVASVIRYLSNSIDS